MADRVRVGLLVRLEAKPGKEEEVASFLRGGLAIVEEEPATVSWFAIQMGPSASSTCFRMRQDGRHTWLAVSRRR